MKNIWNRKISQPLSRAKSVLRNIVQITTSVFALNLNILKTQSLKNYPMVFYVSNLSKINPLLNLTEVSKPYSMIPFSFLPFLCATMDWWINTSSQPASHSSVSVSICISKCHLIYNYLIQNLVVVLNIKTLHWVFFS